MKIFISHSSQENELAEYFASWFENNFENLTCFCSSRPDDLSSGDLWRDKIVKNIEEATIFIILMSQTSVNKMWLHFESGIFLGANKEKKLIPAIYGSINKDNLPSTLTDRTVLELDNSREFNSFISRSLLNNSKPKTPQSHSSFEQTITSNVKRVYKYGEIANTIRGNVTTHRKNNIILDNSNLETVYKKSDTQGQLAAMRATIIPKQIGDFPWKFGFEIHKTSVEEPYLNRYFQFHAGFHFGFSSWTIYHKPWQMDSVNIPAHLETEKECGLEIWLNRDQDSVICVGIDSDNKRNIILNDRNSEKWQIFDNSWSEVKIAAWADGKPFKVIIKELEVDTLSP